MSSTQAKIEVVYESGATRTYTIPVDSLSMASTMKTRIAEINNNTGTGANYATAMKETFVSDENSPMWKIASATIIETTEEVIFSG